MNNYIFAYYEEIKAGRIIAGRWIFLWYSLIVERIQSGTYIYDDKKPRRRYVLSRTSAGTMKERSHRNS